MTGDIELRPIVEDEWDTFRAALSRAFGGDPDSEEPNRLAETMSVSRTLAAFDGPDIVGTFGDLPKDLTVPGGAVAPMGGTTIVTVAPTHRRRGLMARMMERHLADVRGRGEAFAGLWATEAAIYGRFGFGSATDMLAVEVDMRQTTPPPIEPDLALRLVDDETARAILPGVYDRVKTTRPGMLGRRPEWWEGRLFPDPESWREGASARRTVVAMRNREAVGYATYRQKSDWGDTGPAGTVNVIEVIATDPGAHRSLWGFLCRIDLFPVVKAWNVPVDDPLWWQVPNSRAFIRRLSDGLWLRLLDLVAALELRRYETDGALTISVTDRLCPWNDGVWSFDVSAGEATVASAPGPADVSCDIRELGALYLGGRSASTLAAAGLLEGGPGAILELDRLFRGSIAPWCQEVF